MKCLRVLVACETSGRIRDAFRALGHDAYSCDIEPTEADGPHILDDARNVVQDHWDLLIAHPPCTHLAVSGARYFKRKREDGRQQEAIDFFMDMINAPIPHIGVENPISIMSTVYRKPDQIIQPYQFGHPESKATCLWLKNLPPLTPTNILSLPESGHWENQTPSGQNKLGPSANRARIRSRTYEGIAKAIAYQWSIYLIGGHS